MIEALFPGDSKTLSAPGKTFLIGEYLALDGGPSIVVATSPRFVLRASKVPAERSSSPNTPPFAEASPAGRFILRHSLSFSGLELDFFDPHAGEGGLGASSAQFALLYALAKGWEDGRNADWRELLEEYRACAWSGEGTAPSGADVVAQVHGGITFYDGRDYSAKGLAWRFPSLSFTLLRTGEKLATHEHLQRRDSVGKAALHEALREQVMKAKTAFETNSERELVAAIRAFGAELGRAGLVAERTRQLLGEIEAEPGLALAAKGCGALGADVILVLHERARDGQVAAWAESRGLGICGSLSALSPGIRDAIESEAT